MAADQSAAGLSGVQRGRHVAASHQLPPALDHAPRGESAAGTRQQSAPLPPLLPALHPGLSHQDAAAMRRRAAPGPVSRSDHRAGVPAGTPARDQADLVAKLYFYYSTMNAGKSTALLQASHNYEERGMRTLLYTAQIDNRDGGRIRSRIGIEREAM